MINILIILLIVGAALYLIQFVPIDNTIKRIIQVVVIIAAIIYVLRNLGALGIG